MPSAVVQKKFHSFTPTSAGRRFATKNGTAGTRRNSSSTSISVSWSAAFSRWIRPSLAAILADSVAPSPQRAARKIAIAPMVAAITLNAVPAIRPNRNPPVIDATAAPGSEKATITM